LTGRSMGAEAAGDIFVFLPYKGAGVAAGGGLAEVVHSELAGGLIAGAVVIVLGDVCAGLLLFAEGEGSCDGDDDGHGGEDKFESFHAKKITGIHRSDATVKKKSPRGALVDYIDWISVFFVVFDCGRLVFGFWFFGRLLFGGCPFGLSSVGAEDGHFFFVRVVIGLFDDVVPLFVRHVDEEDLSGLVIFYVVLKFFGHHFFTEEPACIAVCGIAVHGILIGELVPGGAGVGFLDDQFFQAVDLGDGQGGAVEEDIACAVGQGLCCVEDLISDVADGEDIALVLAEQAFADNCRVFAGGYVEDNGFEGGIGGDILLRLVHSGNLLKFFVNRLLCEYGC